MFQDLGFFESVISIVTNLLYSYWSERD